MNDKSDPMTHDTGSVADEAMKLMESLGAWAAGSQQSHAGGSEAGSNEATTANGTADATTGPGGSGHARCACSDEPVGHAPAVCRVCPICRVGAFLEGLSPEVMERFADLIAMVAGSLQAVAHQRRAEADTAAPEPNRAERPTTHKVRVTGDGPEDEHASATDDGVGD